VPVKPKSVETERCRKCDTFRETTVMLDTKIKVAGFIYTLVVFLMYIECSGVYTLTYNMMFVDDLVTQETCDRAADPTLLT
jgi:hypothetical protein